MKCEQCGKEQKKRKVKIYFGVWSNGRKTDFDSVGDGSIPSTPVV